VRVRVDVDSCQGHTLCSISAAEIFKHRDEDGQAYVENQIVPKEMENAVLLAQASCPEQAIEVTEWSQE
jgi:ferredoxin